jgi:hypothetical protein
VPDSRRHLGVLVFEPTVNDVYRGDKDEIKNSHGLRIYSTKKEQVFHFPFPLEVNMFLAYICSALPHFFKSGTYLCWPLKDSR